MVHVEQHLSFLAQHFPKLYSQKYLLRKHMGKKGLQRIILNEGQRRSTDKENNDDAGEITEPLLRHWLKNDVEGKSEGITAKDLTLLLHRPTALYAARKKAVESEEAVSVARGSRKKTSSVSTKDIGNPKCKLDPSGKGYEFVYQSAALEHFE